MPTTVIVNKMTAAHSGSSGMSIAFPDVCKTPIPPAGPVPIPYPNIAQTSDAAKEAKKVKLDGSKLMVKGSNLRMSSGDEAGTAQGVASSKIKGKAEFANYSFDVKAAGKNVCRLADPMQQNMGSANAFGPAELQAPGVIVGEQLESCEKSQEKADEQKAGDTSWGNCGIVKAHRPKIQKVVNQMKIQLWFRATNEKCGKWISRKHRPKPHAVIKAKTISAANRWRVQRWYVNMCRKYVADTSVRSMADVDPEVRYVMGKFYRYRAALGFFDGIVMILDSSDEYDGMPMRAHPKLRGGWKSISKANGGYRNKWITGDYDLMDVMDVEGACVRPTQTRAGFVQIRDELNKAMGWDGIQHGPQAQWAPKYTKEGAAHGQDFSIPEQMVSWLNSSAPAPPKVNITPERQMSAVDDNLTVVYPGGTVTMKSHGEVKDGLICMGCKAPDKKRSTAK